MNNKLKLSLIALAGAATIAAGALVNTQTASAEDLIRISGTDRYQTSVEISKQIGGANSAVLVSGESFADALAATTLAKVVNGPVLLTKRDKTPDSVVSELFRILPAPQHNHYKIYVLGGTSVINQGQLDWLAGQGYVIERLAGTDRMDTSVKVSITIDNLLGRAPSHIFLVNGYQFADGLAVGPYAASSNLSVVSTESGDLSQTVRDYLNGNIDTLEKVTIVGGTAAVPSSVDQLLTDHGWIVERIAGKDRYETATLIGERMGGSGIGFASGKNWPDGLSAGPLLTKQGYSLILDEAKSCGSTAWFLQNHSSTINTGYVLGGTSAVSSAAEAVAEALIGGAKPCTTALYLNKYGQYED